MLFPSAEIATGCSGDTEGEEVTSLLPSESQSSPVLPLGVGLLLGEDGKLEMMMDASAFQYTCNQRHRVQRGLSHRDSPQKEVSLGNFMDAWGSSVRTFLWADAGCWARLLPTHQPPRASNRVTNGSVSWNGLHRTNTRAKAKYILYAY